MTTPIYYVNDVPHIGHAYTTVVADVLARWRRLWGDDVVFLTGTDEHGLKVAAGRRGARASRPQEWADQTSERFREAWKLLDITNDDFIRTTEPRHRVGVEQFLQRVYDNGDIELDTYEGLYCVACELYYTEDDLVDGNCPIHGIPVERVTEENYFFRLSRYEDRLLEHYTEHPEAIEPAGKRNEVLGLIKQGLLDFSVSRTSISWGIPLPWDPKHVTYVWFDALVNYCTAVGYGSDPERFDRYWPANYHLIGKDILRQHAVYWPAMLMAAGEAPPKHVFAHGFLLVGGEKMSKTAHEPDRAGRSRRRVRRRRLPLPLPRGPALRPRRRLQLRGDGRALQRRPREQLRQPREPRAEHGGELLSAASCPTRATTVRSCDAVAAAFDGADATALDELDFSRRLRRGVAAHPGRERVHRGSPAVGAAQGGRRGRDRRGARRLSRGAADRRAARVAGDPARGRRALAPPRPPRRRRRSSGSPTRRRGGAPRPRATPLEKGAPLFPRIDRPD